MRRRIAAIVTGVGLLLGAAGALTPSGAAVLCPPGCVLTGVAKTAGGFPDPTSISMSGSITVLVSTRSGETAADAVSVGSTYYLYIGGSVTTGANGTISGSALFHGSRYTPLGYDSFGGTVTVSGTRDALRFSSPNLEATLLKVGADYQGTVVSYG